MHNDTVAFSIFTLQLLRFRVGGLEIIRYNEDF